MAADVFLAFGADTGPLEASLARAQAEVRRTATEMRNLAGDMAKTGSSMDSEMGSRLSSLGAKLSEAKEHVTGFKEELKGAGEGEGFIGGMVEKVKDFLAPLNSLKLGLAEMAEAAAAAFAVEKLYEFVRGMGELGEQTLRAAAMMGTTTQEISALNYTFTLAGVDIAGAAQAINRFQLGLAQAQDGTGKVAAGLQALGLSAAELVHLSPEKQLEKLADAISKFADTPTKTAAVEALGRQFLQLLPTLNEGAEGLRKMREQAEAAGVVLSEGLSKNLAVMDDQFDDLGQAIKGDAITAFAPFIEAVDAAVEGMRSLTQAFQDSARDGGAVAQVLFFIADALRLVEEGIAIVVHAMELLWHAIGAVLDPLLAAFQGLGRMAVALWADIKSGDVTFSHMRAAGVDASAEIKKAFNADFDGIKGDLASLDQDFKNVFKTIMDGSREAGDRMRDALHPPELEGPAKPATPAIDDTPWGKATREVENLTEALKANADALAGRHTSVDAAFFEQRKSNASVQVGGTAPVFAEALEKAIKDAEAATGAKASIADLYRSTETQARIRREHEAMPGGIAPHRGAMPGSSMHEIGGAADLREGAVLDWLHAHIAQYPELEFLTGKTGANDPGHIQFRGGRSSQATLERSTASSLETGPPPTGAEREKLLEEQRNLNLELDKAKQKLLDIKTEEAGGTEASKAKLKADQDDAIAKGDALAHAKDALAAAEKDLANAEKIGATDERKLKLRDDVAKAQKAVNDAEQKQIEAAGRLEISKAKAANDVEKEKAAELALADAKIKAAGADKAAHDAAVADKINIEKRYADQSKSLSMQKANEEISAARTAAQDKIKNIDLEFRAKQISESQKVALTKAALDEEIAAERAILNEELKLDGLRPAERQKILAQLQAAETKYSQQIKETQLKAAEDSAKAWKSMADQIAGAINSQIDGILEGTTSVKQAFSNMTKSMIEDAVKFAVKWAAEHAAAALANMAVSNATNAAQIAGNTAVAASQTASGAAGIASQAANATTSIAIDGAKTFGGVFGFLAPLLGPFAGGPAAAAEATVLAAGSAFDAGAWELPRDMIAGVHRGEMIIPSRGGIADEFRTFISAGGLNPQAGATGGASAATGGTRSVSVNPAVHFNVSANDGQSVAAFFRGNQKAIVRAVDQAVRHGSTLGLRAFTP